MSIEIVEDDLVLDCKDNNTQVTWLTFNASAIYFTSLPARWFPLRFKVWSCYWNSKRWSHLREENDNAHLTWFTFSVAAKDCSFSMRNRWLHKFRIRSVYDNPSRIYDELFIMKALIEKEIRYAYNGESLFKNTIRCSQYWNLTSMIFHCLTDVPFQWLLGSSVA